MTDENGKSSRQSFVSSTKQGLTEKKQPCPQLPRTKKPTAVTADMLVQSQADDKASDSSSKDNSESDCQTVDNSCVRISDNKEQDAESLSVLNSSSCSSDPSNLYNLQAPLDEGLCEASGSSSSAAKSGVQTKKVRFCDNVREVFISSEEDRQGPWMTAALDRFRFQKRCEEVEMKIGYCLLPMHRSIMYNILYGDDKAE